MANPEVLTNEQNSQRDLEGKVAIVTGAASGIGRATALLFAARGAHVVGEDINPAVKELSNSNERILPFVGDVASEDSAKRVVALALERFGKLDAVINNAGYGQYGIFETIPKESVERNFDVNDRCHERHTSGHAGLSQAE